MNGLEAKLWPNSLVGEPLLDLLGWDGSLARQKIGCDLVRVGIVSVLHEPLVEQRDGLGAQEPSDLVALRGDDVLWRMLV